jgi:tetratricopeptide (TPR) repeat protein
MSPRGWYGVAALTALAAVAGVASVAGSAAGARPSRPEAPTPEQVRNLDIAFFRARVARDPRGARDLAQLASLYLQRARETGDNGDLERAEASARQSLALRRGRNEQAYGVLASTLLAQHRFAESLDVGRALLAMDSSSVAARGLVAETELELGDYVEAGRLFGMLSSYRADPGIAPRLARWEELRGRPLEARRLMRAARDVAARRHAMPREQLAWFQLRLGDLALRAGRLGEATRELEAGLRLLPSDARLLAALSRVYAARHEWRQAAETGELAVSRTLDPATLGLLADAYTALGEPTKAEAYDRAMGLSVLRQPGPYHRAWSLYLLDHGRDVAQVLAKIRQELVTRRDVYGYDLLAWALHKSGRDREALEPMRIALSLGTRDAMLYYHAGTIQLALGDTAAARRSYTTALDINPYWHPTQPGQVRAWLLS